MQDFLNCEHATNLNLALERLLRGCQWEEAAEEGEEGELLQEWRERGQAREEEGEGVEEVEH